MGYVSDAHEATGSQRMWQTGPQMALRFASASWAENATMEQW